MLHHSSPHAASLHRLPSLHTDPPELCHLCLPPSLHVCTRRALQGGPGWMMRKIYLSPPPLSFVFLCRAAYICLRGQNPPMLSPASPAAAFRAPSPFTDNRAESKQRRARLMIAEARSPVRDSTSPDIADRGSPAARHRCPAPPGVPWRPQLSVSSMSRFQQSHNDCKSHSREGHAFALHYQKTELQAGRRGSGRLDIVVRG